MANIPVEGYRLVPGTTQAPLSVVTDDIHAPAEDIAIDEKLPVVGNAVLGANRIENVVISKFNLVGPRPDAPGSNNAGSKMILTLAGPRDADANPIGAAFFDLYKEYVNRPEAMQGVFIKHQYIRYPFVDLAVNDTTLYNSNLNGDLLPGDYLAPDSKGRPVKWIEKKNFTFVGKLDASKEVALTPLVLRYVPVSNLRVVKSDGTVHANATVAWDTDKWVLTDSDGSQNDVVIITLDYGHSPSKMWGQVGRIRTGLDVNSLAKYMRREIGNIFPLMPLVNTMVLGKVTAQELTIANATTTGYVKTISADGILVTIATPYKYLDPTVEMKVEYSQDGTNYVTLANHEYTLQYGGQHLGPNFSVEPVNGVFYLYLPGIEATASTSKVKLTFSYETGYPDTTLGFAGVGQGIKNLTDGRFTQGVAGIKPAAALHPSGQAILDGTAPIASSGTMHVIVL